MSPGRCGRTADWSRPTSEEAVARRADFSGSDLSRAVFAGTDLREASFVAAIGYDFDIRDNQVRGTRFDLLEAGKLLRPFGIELVEPGQS